MKSFMEIMNGNQSIYQSCIELKEYFKLDVDIEKYKDMMSKEHEDVNNVDIVIGKYVLEKIIGMSCYELNNEMIEELELYSKEIMDCMRCRDDIKKLFNALNDIIDNNYEDTEYRICFMIRNFIEYCIVTGIENYNNK